MSNKKTAVIPNPGTNVIMLKNNTEGEESLKRRGFAQEISPYGRNDRGDAHTTPSFNIGYSEFINWIFKKCPFMISHYF